MTHSGAQVVPGASSPSGCSTQGSQGWTEESELCMYPSSTPSIWIQLPGCSVGPWLETGQPWPHSVGCCGSHRGFGTRCPPPSQAGCCRGGKGAVSSCEAPTATFHPLQARGFNLITCFICANLFFNQSCSGRRKEAAVGSFAPLVPRERLMAVMVAGDARGPADPVPLCWGCLSWSSGTYQSCFPLAPCNKSPIQAQSSLATA